MKKKKKKKKKKKEKKKKENDLVLHPGHAKVETQNCQEYPNILTNV